MCRPVRWSWLPLLLIGWLVVAGPAPAQSHPSHGVIDEAKLFSPEAKSQADREIDQIKRLYKKDLLILTFPDTKKSPVGKLPDEKSAYQKYFDDWARVEFNRAGVDGVLVLICKRPTILADPIIGNETRKKLFTKQNGTELGKTFLTRLEAKDPDGALRDGVSYVRRILQTHSPATQTKQSHVQPGGGFNQRGGGQVADNPILAWVCIGIAALVVIWLVIGIIRAFSGMGRGGYAGGYGGGGGMGGGYGGGGGGGFMSGLMGGLFGAVAGNWLYNSFMGGGQHSTWSNPGGGGGDWGGGGDPGRRDTEGEAAGGGGDWGGGDAGGDDKDKDKGGGDAGGGGGDWGGGGGGDGGGGGGDGGGGGGGDWGGGGGGDGGGGGGGDWGGGGGGDFGGGGGGGGGGDW